MTVVTYFILLNFTVDSVTNSTSSPLLPHSITSAAKYLNAPPPRLLKVDQFHAKEFHLLWEPNLDELTTHSTVSWMGEGENKEC